MARDVAKADALTRLKQDIRSKSLGRLYVFWGDEVFLMHHYLDKLRELALDELTRDFNHHRFSQETFSLQALAEAVEALPMMAEHTFVEVDEIDLFKLPEGDRDRAAELLADLPDYCTLVLTYEVVPWKPDKRQKKLWTALEHHGQLVEFPKQSPRELVAWVSRHFGALGKKIDGNLAAYLIDITDGTMTALQSEIRKIAAYSGADTIVKADIDAVTEPVLDAVVFQMTDALGLGQYAQALEKLQQLLKMQLEPVAILGAVGGHLRRISAARTVMDQGKNTAELIRLTGLKEYPAKKIWSAAQRFSPEFCRKAAGLVLETDHRMKTSYDDPQRLLELLILQLAQ